MPTEPPAARPAAEPKTLVIHMDDRSTDFLKAIYEGNGYDVINYPVSPAELRTAIEAHGRIFMLGHGCSGGLFGPGFLINDSFGPLLRDKQDCLFIWCHADPFVRHNRLSGLTSGMFISEVGEAAMNGIRATQAEVDASNAAFAATVRACFDQGESRHTVAQHYTHATDAITKFNNDRLYVMRHGVPEPRPGETEPWPGPKAPPNEPLWLRELPRRGHFRLPTRWTQAELDAAAAEWEKEQRGSDAQTELPGWQDYLDSLEDMERYEVNSQEALNATLLMEAAGSQIAFGYITEDGTCVYQGVVNGAKILRKPVTETTPERTEWRATANTVYWTGAPFRRLRLTVMEVLARVHSWHPKRHVSCAGTLDKLRSRWPKLTIVGYR